MKTKVLANGTWVLIADGEKALFLRNVADGDDPHLEVVSAEERENPPTHEQGADRPGRMPDVGPGHRSALADTDWHALEKERFAEDLAEKLYKKAHAGAFDRIVIVAAPHVLGALREKLHKEVADKVVAEVDKTLTNHPLDEIERILQRELD